MSSGNLVVLIATDTPENVDLLDVVNFVQFTFGGNKTSTLEATSASPQPVARGQSRVNRAESTYGVPMPAQPAAPQAPTTVVFEKAGLGAEGAPALEGQEYVTALLGAMERVNDPTATGADPNAVVNMGTPMFSAPASPNNLKRAESTVGVQEAAAVVLPVVLQPAAGFTPIPRVIVVGCPTMQAASSIIASGLYTVSLVLTVNSVDPFPQVSKLAELSKGAAGGKKPEAKKPDPRDKKKGDPGKPIVAANVATRLKAEYPSAVEVTEFHTFEIGNAALTENIVTEAVQVLKNVEASFLEYVSWTQSRQFSTVTPIPSEFSLLDWTKLRAMQDLARVDVASTVCQSATKLLAGRNDGWNLMSEVEQSLVKQLDVRAMQSGAGSRVVQLVDMNLHEQQVQQREALIRKIQQMRLDQADQSVAAGDGGPSPSALSAPTPAGKKTDKPAGKGGKDSQSLGASPQPPDSTSPISLEIPPPDPLPTIGYPFVVEQRGDIEATNEQDAKWLVRQFVKRSLGRLDCESDASKQLDDLLNDSTAPPSRSATESPLPPLLELSLRDLYRRGTAPSATERLVVGEQEQAGLPSGFDSFPTRSKILFRAVQTHPELELKESEPSIRNALLKKIEQSHTTREKNFALLQTLADQVLQEQFPGSAVPLRAHQYVESIDKVTAEERIVQYVEQHGVDVTRVVRVSVGDDNSHHLQASQQVTAPSQAVLIAAVDAPPSRQKLVENNFFVSGVPTYAQFKSWASMPDGDVRKSVLGKDAFVGSSLNSPTVFVSDATKIVFPYDGSVVRVSDVPLSGSRSVSYAKADLKAALHSSLIPSESPLNQGPGSKRRFTTTFDDGVVFTASQPNIVPRPQTAQPPTAPPLLGGTLGSTLASNAGGGLLMSGTNSFQPTPRVAGQAADAQRTQTPLSSQNPSPVSLGQVQTPGGPNAQPEAIKKSPVPFVFEPSVSGETIITVSKNRFSVSVDEPRGNVTFQFLKRDARKSLVYVVDATGNVAPSIEFEVSRTVDNFSGTVHRYFASGAQQSLFADGSVASRLTPAGAWLFTSIDGARFSKRGSTTTKIAVDVRSKRAVDREASCRVQSRDDGVVITDYFSPPSSEGHTRVVAHADGTVIVSLLGVQTGSSPVLDALFSEVSSLASFGMCSFVIETPRAPRVFLFAPSGPLNSFYVQLGDGSVLERHVMPPQTSESRAYMQTVFCRGSESTLRYNHDSALMFVEPHDVHLATTNPQQQKSSIDRSMSSASVVALRQQSTKLSAAKGSQSMNSIAICEAIPVFDLALGGLRLVDREKYVTSVSGIFDFSEPSVTVTFEKSTVMELLLAMLPSGFHTHVRSKKQLEKLDEEQQSQREERDEEDVDDFPTLVDRLRLLAQTFVVDNRLIQQESLRRPHAPADGKNAESTAPAKAVEAPSASVQEDQDTMTKLLSKNPRPLVLAELQNGGRYEHLMCAADLAAFLKATNNKQWTVASSTCSGEPGVEQIAFYRASGGALLLPFEGSTLEGPGIPWLPKSVQPPRRFVSPAPHGSSRLASATSPASSVMAEGFVAPGTAPDFPLCGALRVLLRYSPLSHAVRAALLASHMEDQVRYAKMNLYAKSLQDAIGKQSDETTANVEYLWSRHGALLSTVSATNLPTQTLSEEPSPVRPGGGSVVSPNMPSIPAQATGADEPLVPPKEPTAPSISVTVENPISFLPESADFGSLVPGFAYHLPVNVKNNTSYTLLFEVFNPPPHNHFGSLTPSFVSVKTHRFLLSPFGDSTVNVMATLSPDAVKSIMTRNEAGVFDECLRLECHALKTMFRLRVTGKCNFASNANQALRTDVHILGAAR